jgi:hypothetical protein
MNIILHLYKPRYSLDPDYEKFHYMDINKFCFFDKIEMNEFRFQYKEGDKFKDKERYWETTINEEDIKFYTKQKIIFFTFDRPETYKLVGLISSTPH